MRQPGPFDPRLNSAPGVWMWNAVEGRWVRLTSYDSIKLSYKEDEPNMSAEYIGTVGENPMVRASTRLTLDNPAKAFPKDLSGDLMCVLDRYVTVECYVCKSYEDMMECDAVYGSGNARTIEWYDVVDNVTIVSF